MGIGLFGHAERSAGYKRASRDPSPKLLHSPGGMSALLSSRRISALVHAET